MKSKIVGVFCGAGGKMADDYKKLAFDLGFALAQNGFDLVTGGANVGMMKEVVDGHVKGGAKAIRHGILPTIFREYGINHPDILAENMHWPADVHGRLKGFYELADDIVVCPGGFGTLHELMDCLVHIQFNLIKKRIILINYRNFWDPLLQQFKNMVVQHAVQSKHVDNLHVIEDINELIIILKSEKPIVLAQGLEASRWESE